MPTNTLRVSIDLIPNRRFIVYLLDFPSRLLADRLVCARLRRWMAWFSSAKNRTLTLIPSSLSADDAKLWMDLDWSAEQAEQIARETALPPEAFEWYRVGKEVNKAGHNGPEPIEPLKVD